MRSTRVILTSWINSITSKISWIVGGPWSNRVCLCECASLSVCNWFYKLIHGPQKQILVFLSGNLDFGLQKSWKSHGTFFLRFFVGTLICHCLRLGHETMVCAVCISVFLWRRFPHYWPLVRETTDDRWIFLSKGQECWYLMYLVFLTWTGC